MSCCLKIDSAPAHGIACTSTDSRWGLPSTVRVTVGGAVAHRRHCVAYIGHLLVLRTADKVWCQERSRASGRLLPVVLHVQRHTRRVGRVGIGRIYFILFF